MSSFDIKVWEGVIKATAKHEHAMEIEYEVAVVALREAIESGNKEEICKARFEHTDKMCDLKCANLYNERARKNLAALEERNKE